MLKELRAANEHRQQEWPGAEQCDIAFRTIEVAGEAGELAEAVKKYLRAERGITGSTTCLGDISREMADVIIAVDLLAIELGINLENAVRAKFNETSEKYKMGTKLK